MDVVPELGAVGHVIIDDHRQLLHTDSILRVKISVSVEIKTCELPCWKSCIMLPCWFCGIPLCFIFEETMSQLKPSTLALLPLFLSLIIAENADLVGCNEVSCPRNGADDRCTVEDETFLGVGVSHIPDVPTALEGFSLVKGVNVSAGMAGKDNDKPTRAFTSVYYLGMPEEADTEGLSGCAVIFNNSRQEVRRP